MRSMPIVLKINDNRMNWRVEIVVAIANKETPISSGRGDAIMKPPIMGRTYFLTLEGVFFLISLKIFNFDSLLISSLNEVFINLKIRKSLVIAPRGAMIAVIRIVSCWPNTKSKAVAGAAVNP